MRVARVEFRGAVRAAIVAPDAESVRVLDLAVSVPDLLGDDRNAAASRVTDEVGLTDVQLLAPVRPPSIRDFSVFEQHIEGVIKNGNPAANIPDSWYASPFCYFSNPGAVTGPDEQIPVPPGCERLDLELEVAAVIGRPGRDVRPQDAGAYIAGYTIFNDWSARDLQMTEMALGLGTCKGKDFANTFGPWIVTADELEDYRSGDRLDLDLRAEVNGVPLGGDTLANMAWSFEELFSYASRGTWVQAGDVLGSGTCGNGCLFELWGRRGSDVHPPLGPGDTVTLTVEGIGTLTNTVIAGRDPITLPPARPGRLRERATA
jgi:2-keto-4-pentenoate hydratase/2-oxohepta-3-ene-1,7-dioic acid hydratase in catechol pathway